MQSSLEEIAEFFGSKFIKFSESDDLQTRAIKCQLFLSNEQRNKYGKDPCYNNHWRAYFQKRQLIDAFNLQDEPILDPNGSTGADFLIKELGIYNGEMKGEWMDNKRLTLKSLGNVRFDKQNDRIRRKAIYDYDSLIYSQFKRSGNFVFSVIIVGLDKMKLIHPLIEDAQSKKLVEINLCESIDKRLPRDDIKISVLKLIHLLKNQDMTIIYKGEKISKEDFLLSISGASNLKLLW